MLSLHTYNTLFGNISLATTGGVLVARVKQGVNPYVISLLSRIYLLSVLSCFVKYFVKYSLA